MRMTTSPRPVPQSGLDGSTGVKPLSRGTRDLEAVVEATGEEEAAGAAGGEEAVAIGNTTAISI
jgi:hypothetical protein